MAKQEEEENEKRRLAEQERRKQRELLEKKESREREEKRLKELQDIEEQKQRLLDGPEQVKINIPIAVRSICYSIIRNNIFFFLIIKLNYLNHAFSNTKFNIFYFYYSFDIVFF